MDAFFQDYGWRVVGALFAGAGGLALWVLKREIDTIKRLGERIQALEDARLVTEARTEAWKEFGAPERRRLENAELVAEISGALKR